MEPSSNNTDKHSRSIKEIQIEVIKDAQINQKQWEGLRLKYVGSSEIGVIIKSSSFKTPKELLLQKLGHLAAHRNSNMYIGLLYEKDIADKLRYFDTDIEQCYQNYVNNKPVRHIRKETNSFLLHFLLDDGTDVPIVVSPDYLMTEDMTSDTYYPVDIKFVSYLSSSYLTGKVSDYVWQSIMQQLCYDVKTGYLFYQIGNNDIKLTRIDIDDYLPFLDTILNEVAAFYQDLEKYRSASLSQILKDYYPEQIYEGELTSPIERPEIVQGSEDDNPYVEKYVELRNYKSNIENAMKEVKTYILNRYPEAREILFDRFRVVISSNNYFLVKDRKYENTGE